MNQSFIRAGRVSAACLLSIVCLAMSGCATGLQVRSDADPTASFDRYRTYRYFDPMAIESGYNSPVFGEHFRAAISRELEGRGYRASQEPDLFVNVTIRADDRIRLRSFSRPYISGAYYDQPGGPHYGSAVGVGVGMGQRPTKVTEASVFIDLVDPATERVAWQGVAVVDVNDKVAMQLRDAIYTAVEAVFAQYPYQASR